MQFIRQLLVFLVTALISFAVIGMVVVARLVERATARESSALGIALSLVT